MHRLSSLRVERTIAGTRVALAALSLLAIWLDPAEPARYVDLVYALHLGYVGYAVLIAALTRTGVRWRWLPLATHVFDIIAFSAFQFFTTGPSSPFFIYFVFYLFCSALRWGWRGTLTAIPIVVGAYVVVVVSMTPTFGAADFELNRFIIRLGYLGMVGGLLVYLGRHEARLRDDMQALAQWPSALEGTPHEALSRTLAYAAALCQADRALLVWEHRDEPLRQVADWRPDGLQRATRPADEGDPVALALAGVTFVTVDAVTSPPTPANEVMRLSRGGQTPWRGGALHPVFVVMLAGEFVASAPVRAESVIGRLFLVARRGAMLDLASLLDAVARQVSVSLNDLEIHERQRRIAVGEDRLQVARDLHDGVLQSLTGVRFELQSIAGKLAGTSAESRDRLFALERALALEQRELRLFIEDLKPFVRPAADGSLAATLTELGHRASGQWNVPVTVRVDAEAASRLDPMVAGALVPMVQEAIANAVKHGQPSRVTVDVVAAAGGTLVSVTDDGRGFAFEGRRDHDALGSGPVPSSLRDRMTTLGGRMAIASGRGGARIELMFPARPQGEQR